MKLNRYCLSLMILLPTFMVDAQQPGPGIKLRTITDELDKGGCIKLERSGVRICNFDYKWEGQNVEAISFEPSGDGTFPAILMIPGHERTARDYIFMGERFAEEGFAGVAVTQP